ncbi:bone morphogenetic protein 2-like [Mya arenaria]|uniref:bone morphogenetic protein 2-like n=1 Tax=Mya arenaria TaxID=6604 RepID=UPI0022E18D82|nr:bone morphogenetic protein 2-like [Mya arenaria]
MKNLFDLNKLTKSGFILITVIGNLCALSFAAPASEDSYGDENSDTMNEKIESIKAKILEGLGYARPPVLNNITRNIEEKRRMIKEYRKYMEDREVESGKRFSGEDMGDDDDEGTSLVSNHLHTFKNTGAAPPNVDTTDWRVTKAIRLYFDGDLEHPKDDFNKELVVNSAKLRVNVKKVKPDNLKDQFSVDKVLRINAYQILTIQNSTNYKRTLIDSKLVSLTDTGVQSFEITKAVQSWINDNKTNLGIELAAEAQDINELVELEMPLESKTKQLASGEVHTNSPTLDVYAQLKDILKRVKRRSRRHGECRRKQGKRICCRNPIRISFADIGWDDWIIAPHEYKGYYCAGDCPYGHKMANTFAVIKELLHMKNPNKVPSPCCVATKLSPFTILHYDSEGKYQFSDYPDLVVDQCKCG